MVDESDWPYRDDPTVESQTLLGVIAAMTFVLAGSWAAYVENMDKKHFKFALIASFAWVIIYWLITYVYKQRIKRAASSTSSYGTERT